MTQVPRIAALLGPLPALSHQGCFARATLRDGGEVLQVDLSPVASGDVWVVGGFEPTSCVAPSGVRWVVANGSTWMRGADAWVEIPTIGTAEGVLSRNHAVLETTLLADASVAVVGLGSGGSVIADQLARAGVGRLVLVDRDRLEVQNVGRHLCDLGDLGRRKTVAVADRLRARNPDIRLDLVDVDVLEDPEALRSAVSGCSVIVAATDSNPSRSLINHLAVEARLPAIFGFARTRAAGGDVIRVVPDGPCWDCMFPNQAPETEITHARSPAATAYADAPARVEPGLCLDIQPIALMCARLTLQELVRGRGSSLESLDADLPGARFLWANRREGDFAGWRPMGFGYSEFAVHRWYGMRVPRNAACPTCNESAFLSQLLAQNKVRWE